MKDNNDMLFKSEKIKLFLSDENFEYIEDKKERNNIYNEFKELSKHVTHAYNTALNNYISMESHNYKFFDSSMYQENKMGLVRKELNKLKKKQSDDDKKACDYIIDFLNDPLNVQEHHECSSTNTVYRDLSEKYSGLIGRGIVTAINNKVKKDFDNTISDIRYGSRTSNNYKLYAPIPGSFPKTFKFVFNDNGSIGLIFNNAGIKKYYFGVILGNGVKANHLRVFFQKFKSGEYKLKQSKIFFNKKDGSPYISVSYEFKKSTPKNIDPSIVCGIDLGVNVPLFLALNKGFRTQVIGNRREIFQKKNQFSIRKTEARKSAVLARSGKGRKRKSKYPDNIRNKEANWVKTKNEQFASRAVDFCLKENAGTIHMEDLSNIKKQQDKNPYLVNWQYYNLQQKIQQKAEENGIEVRYVVARNTSKCCNECGEIGIREKVKRINKSGVEYMADVFLCENIKCKVYNKEIHGDKNGALNIAKSTNFSDKKDNKKKKEKKDNKKKVATL